MFTYICHYYIIKGLNSNRANQTSQQRQEQLQQPQQTLNRAPQDQYRPNLSQQPQSGGMVNIGENHADRRRRLQLEERKRAQAVSKTQFPKKEENNEAIQKY